MANTTITTDANATALYNNVSTVLPVTTAVTVLLIDGLEMTITADKTQWTGAGPLTYTLVITNTSELPYTAPVALATNAFDDTLFTCDTSSVTVSDNTLVSADFNGGILNLELSEDIGAGGGTTTITFQITRV